MLRLQGFEHLRIWPRGVDMELFQPERNSAELRASWLAGREHPENKTVLLYVGRVSWEKNLRLLIQAYQGMDHTNCHLVIVGDGPAYAEVQQELSNLPVTFTGYLRGAELATAYASADIFAFPSYTETFGQVVLEAMASGLPVVGLLSEGVCDLVEDGRTGFLLDTQKMGEEEQATGYRERLQRLVQDQARRHEMSIAAAVYAHHHTWHEAMECLVRGYNEVIDAHQPLVAA
jgi:glycosyltransferase involved in cell wall biosynthesis